MDPVAMNGLLSRDWNKVFGYHMANLGEDGVLDDEVLSRIINAYQTVVVSAFGSNDTNACSDMQFCLKVLMLFDLVIFNDNDMNTAPETQEFTFRVVDDTIFDEAVYSTNHLLWAPGASKPNTSGLHPVTVDSLCMMKAVRFSDIFSADNAGYALWDNNLVTGPVGDSTPCLVDMKPSSSYPRIKSWFSTCNKEEINSIDLNS
jgi:hypothetical protein